MIDLYLSDAYYCHWPDIQNLARSEDPAAFEKLKKYALEGYVFQSTSKNGFKSSYPRS
jgi:hypothetical protein